MDLVEGIVVMAKGWEVMDFVVSGFNGPVIAG